MKEKYELTNETIEHEGRTLYKIRATREIISLGCIRHEVGSPGGYIEKEENLSHEGGCWVHENALVFSDARVSDQALVAGYARIYGHARVYGYASVLGNKRLSCKSIYSMVIFFMPHFEP